MIDLIKPIYSRCESLCHKCNIVTSSSVTF